MRAVRSPLIYIIDDEPGTREVLRRFCQVQGCRARSFGRAVDLLMALGETPPSMVLVDLQMPDVHGLSLCKAIKSQPSTQRIPVLLMSGLAGPSDVAAAEQAGANGFLAKPFDLNELRQVLALAPACGDDDRSAP
jgi:CheY-like chemotaxis protein